METTAPRWVRLGVGVTLALPQLVIGFWAVLAPKNWFESFPGFDPRVVASVPPYNASHGCLRVPIPNAWSIYTWVRMGDIVDVYP